MYDWKDRLYGAYQNYIMASRLGHHDVAHRIDGVLYSVLFRNRIR